MCTSYPTRLVRYELPGLCASCLFVHMEVLVMSRSSWSCYVFIDADQIGFYTAGWFLTRVGLDEPIKIPETIFWIWLVHFFLFLTNQVPSLFCFVSMIQFFCKGDSMKVKPLICPFVSAVHKFGLWWIQYLITGLLLFCWKWSMSSINLIYWASLVGDEKFGSFLCYTTSFCYFL